jgi:hypothetical protein
MARFYGEIGYGDSVEDPPGSGVWEDKITEISYYGDVLYNTRNLEPGEGLNDNLKVTNRISIVADEYATSHFFKIKYVKWEGVAWTVQTVEVRSPRLILHLGSVHNGPTL